MTSSVNLWYAECVLLISLIIASIYFKHHIVWPHFFWYARVTFAGEILAACPKVCSVQQKKNEYDIMRAVCWLDRLDLCLPKREKTR